MILTQNQASEVFPNNIDNCRTFIEPHDILYSQQQKIKIPQIHRNFCMTSLDLQSHVHTYHVFGAKTPEVSKGINTEPKGKIDFCIME